VNIIFHVFGNNRPAPSIPSLDYQVSALKIRDNPYNYKHLRKLTGLHKPVQEQVREAKNYYQYLQQWQTHIQRFIDTDCSEINVAIFCHAGRHRSPVVAQDLATCLELPVVLRFYNPAARAMQALIRLHGYDAACDMFKMTEFFTRS